MASIAIPATARIGRRVRIADLRVVAADGTTATAAVGLAGYALGHAGRDWRLDLPAKFRLAGARVDYADEAGARHVALATPSGSTP